MPRISRLVREILGRIDDFRTKSTLRLQDRVVTESLPLVKLRNPVPALPQLPDNGDTVSIHAYEDWIGVAVKQILTANSGFESVPNVCWCTGEGSYADFVKAASLHDVR